MLTTSRAALSVAMLAGFYLVAVLGLLGLGAVAVVAMENDAGALGSKLLLVMAIAGGGIVVSLWRVARARPEPEPGVVLSREEAPELWAQVEDLAAAARTRVPDEIRLIPEVNAAVSEDARFLGLIPGTRRLYLGAPLVMALDVARLRSVLAHELGHYSRSHTRLAALSYRGRTAILATVAQLSGSLVGWPLKQYAKLYLLVSASTTRRQELEADELSVRIAGRRVAQSALLEVPVVDDAWSFYTGAYLGAAWERGLAPTSDRFFAGFAQMCAARTEEIAARRLEPAPQEQSRWDSHPSIAARVAAMDRMPDADVPVDERPAPVLVPRLTEHATRLAEEVVDFGDRRRVDWEELTATTLREEEQLVADVVFRAAGRIAGEQRGAVSTVLELVERGRRDDLLRALDIDPAPAAADDGAADDGAAVDAADRDPVLGPLRAVIGAALVQAGAATWRHRWSGPAELVAVGGEPIDLDALARGGADPATVAQVRERLAALGVDLTRTGQVGQQGTAHGAQLLAGLAGIDVDGAKTDLLLLDFGLVLVPAKRRSGDDPAARLTALARSGSPLELATAHRYLPFEEVASATVHRRTPIKAELHLHDGRTVAIRARWSTATLSKGCLTTALELVESLAARSAVPS